MINQITPPLHQNFIRAVCGPLTLEFLGYDSVADYDRDAGYPGACLEDALSSAIHRETLQRFDKHFSPWVEAISGVPRAVNTVQTEKEQRRDKGSKKPIMESIYRYMTRVCGQRPDLEKQIKEEALRQSRAFRISSAPASRLAPIEPSYLARAKSMLTQELSWIDEKVSPMLTVCPDFILARDSYGKPELEPLARLIQHYTNTLAAIED